MESSKQYSKIDIFEAPNTKNDNYHLPSSSFPHSSLFYVPFFPYLRNENMSSFSKDRSAFSSMIFPLTLPKIFEKSPAKESFKSCDKESKSKCKCFARIDYLPIQKLLCCTIHSTNCFMFISTKIVAERHYVLWSNYLTSQQWRQPSKN